MVGVIVYGLVNEDVVVLVERVCVVDCECIVVCCIVGIVIVGVGCIGVVYDQVVR